MIRARTLEELVDAAALLSSQPLPRGRRVGVVTNAGGLGILCADACEAAGLELPELSEATRAELAGLAPAEASLANPVDLLGSATAATYEAVIPHVLADPSVDALIVLFVPPVVAGADEVAAAVRRAVERAGDAKPVIAVVVSAEGTPAALLAADSPVAALPYPESAARALAVAAARGEWLRRPAGATIVPGGSTQRAAEPVVEAALAREHDTWLTPAETRSLLEAYGMPVVPELIAATADETVAAARELGLPAVVKTAARARTRPRAAASRSTCATRPTFAGAFERIGVPVIVQPFLHGGAELLAGRRPGPRLRPARRVRARRGPRRADRRRGLPARAAHRPRRRGARARREPPGKLVRGFRGAPPADSAALVDLILRIGRLADDLPEVAELDLNPVLAGPRRLRRGRRESRVRSPRHRAPAEELVSRSPADRDSV